MKVVRLHTDLYIAELFDHLTSNKQFWVFDIGPVCKKTWWLEA